MLRMLRQGLQKLPKPDAGLNRVKSGCDSAFLLILRSRQANEQVLSRRNGHSE